MLINAINDCIGISLKIDSGQQEEFIETNFNFNGHSILIAEDIEINREIMTALLEGTGISIDFAENGKQAVSIFEKNPDKYGLILMDVNMPEMDGYEATKAIRALKFEEAKYICIIAMTANVFREDIVKCLSVGMNDHIGKPIDLNDLLKKLNKYLATSVNKGEGI
jgi:CheY-like chemotaxis protein